MRLFMRKKHDYESLLKYMKILEEGYSFFGIEKTGKSQPESVRMSRHLYDQENLWAQNMRQKLCRIANFMIPLLCVVKLITF